MDSIISESIWLFGIHMFYWNPYVFLESIWLLESIYLFGIHMAFTESLAEKHMNSKNLD
jgi:hypothetical protein